MKTLKYLLLLLVFSATTAYAQSDKIQNIFAEYNITEEMLTENLKDANAEYAFDYKSTITTDVNTTVQFARFDPSKKIGERWTLVSVNGEDPSVEDINTFDQTHNTTRNNVNGKVDEDSWQIEKDTESELVLSFRYNKKSVPRKYRFLADCKGTVYFDKNANVLKKTEFTNEGKPIRVKILKVQGLDMEVDYQLQEDGKTYLIVKEILDMKMRMFGQDVEVIEINEYSNYSKI